MSDDGFVHVRAVAVTCLGRIVHEGHDNGYGVDVYREPGTRGPIGDDLDGHIEYLQLDTDTTAQIERGEREWTTELGDSVLRRGGWGKLTEWYAPDATHLVCKVIKPYYPCRCD